MAPPEPLRAAREETNKAFANSQEDFSFPAYNPETHYLELARSPYYRALISLRHHLRATSDYYFSFVVGAQNLDLFMLTPSVSSPMGPGSDSEAIEIHFGNLHTYLVDSSQFGFEPILMNGHDKLYCYLPSMRGEDPDERHLNQFFHCEAEVRGTLDDLIPLIEGYVHHLAETLLELPAITERLSTSSERTFEALTAITSSVSFDQITFDEAVDTLRAAGHADLINETEHGRDITSAGERALLELRGKNTPLWVTHYDRDRVPFYQKPLPADDSKVINADLLFPPLLSSGFGGEVVGAGQRQDSASEMHESLGRQNLSAEPYLWYIALREQPHYRTSAGFGLGIERFITWALCRSDIKEAIPYPRLKNVLTYP